MDSARAQLDPIRTLSALTDSFAREGHILARASMARPSLVAGTPLEFAYLTRWIELDGGTQLRTWRLMCGSASR